MPQEQDIEEGRVVQGPPPDAPPADTQDRGGSFPWLTAVGFAFLTFNSGMAVLRSQGDPGGIAFAVFSYTALALLFFVLKRTERVGDPEDTNSRRLRITVWTLTVLLSVMFCYKVATVMPLSMAIVVWAMAFASVCGVFFAFFSR